MAPLANQKVLVVGGTSGIGFAVAKAALAEGAHVVISSSNPDKVAAAAKRLGAGDRVTAEVLDVGDEAGIKALFVKLGRVDHVVTTVREGLYGHMSADVDSIRRARAAPRSAGRTSSSSRRSRTKSSTPASGVRAAARAPAPLLTGRRLAAPHQARARRGRAVRHAHLRHRGGAAEARLDALRRGRRRALGVAPHGRRRPRAAARELRRARRGRHRALGQVGRRVQEQVVRGVREEAAGAPRRHAGGGCGGGECAGAGVYAWC
jgi:uncharacterized protein YbjT (DUF2867 family)